jgi:two-component system, response regulator PdtaR
MGQRRKILVVEDEVLIRFFLHDLLLENGWDVLEAGTAEEGLTLINGSSPVDAVISDLQMPGTLDGLDLCWEVHKRAPGTAKILMSGRRLPSKDALPPNTRFFAKPVLADQLLEALTDLLPNRS